MGGGRWEIELIELDLGEPELATTPVRAAPHGAARPPAPRRSMLGPVGPVLAACTLLAAGWVAGRASLPTSRTTPPTTAPHTAASPRRSDPSDLPTLALASFGGLSGVVALPHESAHGDVATLVSQAYFELVATSIPVASTGANG